MQMPAKDGKLTPDEQERIKTWLAEKRAILPCPVCGNNGWSIAENLALGPLFIPGGAFVIGAGFPAVLIVCTRCTFFRWHSAVAMGIVPQEADQRKAEQEAKHGS
jgi:hypothetical protein